MDPSRYEHLDLVTAAQVQTCRQRGQKVILTVGGADNGFNFDDRTKSQNFVQLFPRDVDGHGRGRWLRLQQLRGQRSGSSPTEMIWIAQQLRAAMVRLRHHGAAAAQRVAQDRSMLKAMSDAGVLTYAAPQYYDWTGFNDAGFISRRIASGWRCWVTPARWWSAWAATIPTAPAWTTASASGTRIKRHTRPFAAMFCWSAQTDLSAGNACVDKR